MKVGSEFTFFVPRSLSAGGNQARSVGVYVRICSGIQLSRVVFRTGAKYADPLNWRMMLLTSVYASLPPYHHLARDTMNGGERIHFFNSYVVYRLKGSSQKKPRR